MLLQPAHLLVQPQQRGVSESHIDVAVEEYLHLPHAPQLDEIDSIFLRARHVLVSRVVAPLLRAGVPLLCLCLLRLLLPLQLPAPLLHEHSRGLEKVVLRELRVVSSPLAGLAKKRKIVRTKPGLQLLVSVVVNHFQHLVKIAPFLARKLLHRVARVCLSLLNHHYLPHFSPKCILEYREGCRPYHPLFKFRAIKIAELLKRNGRSYRVGWPCLLLHVHVDGKKIHDCRW
mmetsp:Transcript_16219/g.35383  ORF Transcript_16219/g.35383 Transcript_16219/m.35383 type:complete len:230 (+) Transcript_16219:829-1518(+)